MNFYLEWKSKEVTEGEKGENENDEFI